MADSADDLLARMRGQYQYATLEDHMLVDGVLYGRCGVCRENPIPRSAGSVRWCDPCLDECLAGSEDTDAFVARKRST